MRISVHAAVAAVVVAAAVPAAVGQPLGYRAMVSCVGDCRAAWDRTYNLQIDVAVRGQLIGLTLKPRSLAHGPTRLGDQCVGRVAQLRSPWPTRGGQAPCRTSLPLNRTSVTWRSPSCSDDLRSDRIKLNLKAEWQPPDWAVHGWIHNVWSDVFFDFSQAPACASAGRGGGGGGGGGAGGGGGGAGGGGGGGSSDRINFSLDWQAGRMYVCDPACVGQENVPLANGAYISSVSVAASADAYRNGYHESLRGRWVRSASCVPGTYIVIKVSPGSGRPSRDLAGTCG